VSSALDRLVSVRALFVLSALFIVYATTLPFDFAHAPTLARAQLIPLWDPARGRLGSIPDIVQNVVLFMPLGFFWARSWPRRSLLASGALAALLGFALSLTVEILQTMSEVRTPSATDLVTNTLGAGLGGGLGALWGTHLDAWARAGVARLQRRQPGLLVLLGLLAIVAFTLLAPFIPTLDVGALRAQVRSLLDHPFGTRPAGASVPSMVLFAGLGFALAHELPALLRRGAATPSALAAALGAASAVVLAVVFELAQLPLLFHRPSLLDLLAHAAGGAAGALVVVVVYRGRPFTPDRALGTWSHRWLPLVLSFALMAPIARALSPFVLRPIGESWSALELTHLVPFFHLFDTLRVSTFLNVFEAAATYLPLGYILAVRRVPALTAFVLAVALAEGLELAQLAIEGRTVDLTEGLLAAAGALAGRALALGLGAVRPEVAGSVSIGHSARR
jgi:glycopeptide antibiotics resistance protein